MSESVMELQGGWVVTASGGVVVKLPGEPDWRDAAVGTALYPGDAITPRGGVATVMRQRKNPPESEESPQDPGDSTNNLNE